MQLFRDDLEIVNKKWKIYKNLETKRGINFDAFSMPDLLDAKRTPSRFSPENISKNTNAVAEAMQESLAAAAPSFETSTTGVMARD